MKRMTTPALCLACLMLSILQLQAQRAGFQAAGVMPAQLLPLQPSAVNPVRAVGGIPTPGFVQSPVPWLPVALPVLSPGGPAPLSPPFPPGFPPPHPVPGTGHARGISPIIIIIIPNSNAVAAAPPSAGWNGTVMTSPAPGSTVGAPQPLPAIGIGRDQLVNQFGPPLTSIFTLNGETLYLNGGITVCIKNGKVITAQLTNGHH